MPWPSAVQSLSPMWACILRNWKLEENEDPADKAADYVQDFKVFMTKAKAGSFSALNVSFEILIRGRS